MMTGQDGMDERERDERIFIKTGRSEILYTGAGNWCHYFGAKSNKKLLKSIKGGFMVQPRKCSGFMVLAEDGNCVLVGGVGWNDKLSSNYPVPSLLSSATSSSYSWAA